MDPNGFFKLLQQNSPPPVILFKGEAELLMEEAWRRLVAAIVPPNARRFNGIKLSARETPAAEVLSRVGNIPMFGAKQLVMVENFEAWSKDERSIIQDYIAGPHPTACLVLHIGQKKGASKLEAAINKTGIVVNFAQPAERDAPRWLQERAGQKGKRLSPQAALFLLDQVGLDLHRLESELEKLVSYIGDRAAIELRDVEETVSSQRSFSVFELLRYISQRNTQKAMESLRQLLASGEAPLAILALLSRQIRLLWQAKDGVERGLRIPQIIERLKLPPSVVRNYAREASMFSEPELRLIHQALRETDLALKSTGAAPKTLLEALILGLCRPRSRTG